MRSVRRHIGTSSVTLLCGATIAAVCWIPYSTEGYDDHRLDKVRTAMAGRMGTETVSNFAGGPSIDASTPKEIRTATFGMG